ncbi:MAG: UPF0164 family protein [Bacteroidota bacterium]
MKKLRITLFLLPMLMVGALLAQEATPSPTNDRTRKFSNEFLKIGVGARAFGMGQAQTATANDATAGYWNPAAMVRKDALNYPEVAMMHASYFANVGSLNYFGFAMPVDSAGDRYFGVSLVRFGVDDIPNTLGLVEADGTINYDKLQSFSTSQLATMFSYGAKIYGIEGLSAGASIKIVYQSIGQFANAWGFGLDLGLRYQKGNFQTGVTLVDITNTFNAWTFNTETFADAFIQTGNDIPQNSVELTQPSVRFGFAYDIGLGDKLSLLTAVDGQVTLDGNRPDALLASGGVSFDPKIGFELAYLNPQFRKVAFLRGGAYNLQNGVNLDGERAFQLFPTIGAGIVLKNFYIDYALSNVGDLSQNLYSHVISLRFHIQ